MNVTKKDFELIAKVMHANKPKAPTAALYLRRQTWESIVHAFSHALVNTNPRFDKEKFIHYALNGSYK